MSYAALRQSAKSAFAVHTAAAEALRLRTAEAVASQCELAGGTIHFPESVTETRFGYHSTWTPLVIVGTETEVMVSISKDGVRYRICDDFATVALTDLGTSSLLMLLEDIFQYGLVSA